MNAILKDKSFRLSIKLTFIFLATGFVFLYLNISLYGWVFFALLPFVLGFSIGSLPNRRIAYTGMIICVIMFIVGILLVGLEGFICVVMALPIIIPFMFLGIVISDIVVRYKEIKSTEKFPLLILPLLVFLFGAPIEKLMITDKENVIEVKSQIILNYSELCVYDAIKSMDTLISEQTFLMKIGLPVPQKCILEKEEVGANRTCYFSGGKIIEKITKLEKGKILKMDVIHNELTGRKWLGFKEAIYLFDSLDVDRCQMTRITTYTSALRPRFYWEPLERIGIEQEHQFVFSSLASELKKKYEK